MEKKQKNSQALRDMALDVAVILFNPEIKTVLSEGNLISIKEFKGGAVRALDLNGFRFITQNPNTPSKWAKLARDGRKVSWVIRLKDNKWLLRVVDSQTEEL